MSEVYGSPPKDMNYGVIAGIYFRSHEQAMVMERILEKALMEDAGKPHESLLAKWHRDVVSIRRKAARDLWRGWEVTE